jgi:hypothetical protein
LAGEVTPLVRALFLAALVLACSDREPPKRCTLIGASDDVTILGTSNLRPRGRVPVAAELCVGSTCYAKQPVEEGGGSLSLGDGREMLESRPTHISIRFYGPDGALLSVANGSITPETRAPNGPQCEPVVSIATVNVSDDGTTFVQVPRRRS